MNKNLFSLPLFLALFAMSFTTGTHSGYHIGDTAKDFNLKNVTGKMESLSGIKDAKGYIVIFHL